MNETGRIAVVTGANRGLGLEIVRQLARRGLRVVLTGRDEEQGAECQRELSRAGFEVAFHPLDVTREDSVRKLIADLLEAHGGIDVLVNNAGVAMHGFDGEVAKRTIETNFFGPLRLTEASLPHMRADGRVVMMSSGMGNRAILGEALRRRFSDPDLTKDAVIRSMREFVEDVIRGRHEERGWPSNAYSVSKVGLNALTVLLAKELERQGNPKRILINAACPGWVRTRMGGPQASRTVEEGARTPVWLAMLPSGAPSGGFFRDQRPVSW